MSIVEIFEGFADAATEQPLLLIAVLLAIGGAIGQIKIKGFSLGPAAVLFTALAFSAADERLKLPSIIGIFGLAIFAYTIGVGAGSSFFSAIRTGGKALTAIVVALLVGAGVAVLTGHAIGLQGPMVAGAFAGALTNTPALAAASEAWGSDLPTVGYSVTYLFGVLGMLLAASFALKLRPRKGLEAEPADVAVPHLDTVTVRVESEGLPDLGALTERYNNQILFSRIMRGDTPGHPGVVDVATDDAVPVPGDILNAIGDAATLERFVADVGHPSTVALTLDRSALDYRRIAVSNPDVVGVPLAMLRLDRKYGAVATRVRRGDVELLATDDLPLQIGDRVRVVAPRERLREVAKLFGDSEKGASHFSMTGFMFGLALGVLIGMLEFPMPGGATFELGMAGGPLLVGLLVGRVGRTGPILWTLPHGVASTLIHLGMMLFLAYAGSNAGAALADALGTPVGIQLLILGVVVTMVTAVVAIAGSWFFGGMFGPRLAGALAGMQTQPAVLAFANDRTKDDPRVNLGYALIYPAAMIVKVLLAPFIGGM